MSNGRAKIGGETGKNGKFYAGGTFLPSTELPKNAPKSRKPVAPRRQQITRYEWIETPSADARSIYSLIVGTVAQERGGVISRFEPGIAHYGEMIRGETVDNLIDRFNNGERWV